ncbi:hypothetical protein SDC9_170829 [bioreactor metagenome]|uniref:Uncharacterized protein n=1 Tax=bioreactor metagenome TaxID=1076179 RepID=A0A645G952_9ZZZZ
MGNSDTDVTDFAFEQRFHFINVLDAVVDDKNLSVSTHLVVDGLFHHLRIERVNLCLHGISVGRRRVNGRKIARSHQRKLQCARDRRGGHGKRIDIAFQLFQLFFRCNAKLLFFVYNQ